MTFDFNTLVLNKNINYDYNPFGGIDPEDIAHVISSDHSFKQWIDLIEDPTPKIIEFVGKKGRGKTTHLNLLHRFFDDSQILHLDQNRKNIHLSKARLIFVDSIQQLTWNRRMKLWLNRDTTYIITTHISKKWEYKLAKRNYHSFKFKGISIKQLEHILKSRIELASDINPEAIQINQNVLKDLIKRYKDDYRGILNTLFDSFKQREINEYIR